MDLYFIFFIYVCVCVLFPYFKTFFHSTDYFFRGRFFRFFRLFEPVELMLSLLLLASVSDVGVVGTSSCMELSSSSGWFVLSVTTTTGAVRAVGVAVIGFTLTECFDDDDSEPDGCTSNSLSSFSLSFSLRSLRTLLDCGTVRTSISSTKLGF